MEKRKEENDRNREQERGHLKDRQDFQELIGTVLFRTRQCQQSTNNHTLLHLSPILNIIATHTDLVSHRY